MAENYLLEPMRRLDKDKMAAIEKWLAKNMEMAGAPMELFDKTESEEEFRNILAMKGLSVELTFRGLTTGTALPKEYELRVNGKQFGTILEITLELTDGEILQKATERLPESKGEES